MIVAAFVAAPSVVHAQARKLLVFSADSQPIAYALVAVEGATGQITDEHGEVSFGRGAAKTYSVSVRRIGYEQWFGKLQLPDTAAVLQVTLARVAQKLGAVKVTARSAPATLSIPMKGFYDRWLMRQQGLLTGVFIGPEELEFRHPNKISNMLGGLTGVQLHRVQFGDQTVTGSRGDCPMAILIDGLQQLKDHVLDDSRQPPVWIDVVLIDKLINPDDVAAIEVYSRGGNVPSSLHADDSACGVVAFWTGSKKR